MLLTKNIRLKAGKLSLKFIGPFKILKCISKSVYKLELLSLWLAKLNSHLLDSAGYKPVIVILSQS